MATTTVKSTTCKKGLLACQSNADNGFKLNPYWFGVCETQGDYTVNRDMESLEEEWYHAKIGGGNFLTVDDYTFEVDTTIPAGANSLTEDKYVAEYYLFGRALSGTFSANFTTDILTVSQDQYDNWETGTTVRFEQVGSLPTLTGGPTASLEEDTTYYVIKTGTNLEIQLAETLADAIAETPALDLSNAGTGANTICQICLLSVTQTSSTDPDVPYMIWIYQEALTLENQVTITPVLVASVIEFKNTMPMQVNEHNNDLAAHPYLLDLINTLVLGADLTFTGYDEGVSQGTAFAIDVTGSGASASITDNIMTINVPGGGGGGTITGASNVGDGADIFKQDNAGVLEFRGIKGDGTSAVSFAVSSDNIQATVAYASSAEINAGTVANKVINPEQLALSTFNSQIPLGDTVDIEMAQIIAGYTASSESKFLTASQVIVNVKTTNLDTNYHDGFKTVGQCLIKLPAPGDITAGHKIWIIFKSHNYGHLTPQTHPDSWAWVNSNSYVKTHGIHIMLNGGTLRGRAAYGSNSTNVVDNNFRFVAGNFLSDGSGNRRYYDVVTFLTATYFKPISLSDYIFCNMLSMIEFQYMGSNDWVERVHVSPIPMYGVDNGGRIPSMQGYGTFYYPIP